MCVHGRLCKITMDDSDTLFKSIYIYDITLMQTTEWVYIDMWTVDYGNDTSSDIQCCHLCNNTDTK